MWEWKDFCRETEATRNGPSQFAQWGACKTGYGGVAWNGGLPDAATVAKLSRSYAIAVDGTTSTMSFDADTGVFRLVYTLAGAATSPLAVTEIFVQERVHYANGVRVSVQSSVGPGAGGAQLLPLQPGSNRVAVQTTAVAQAGEVITVIVSPM